MHFRFVQERFSIILPVTGSANLETATIHPHLSQYFPGGLKVPAGAAGGRIFLPILTGSFLGVAGGLGNCRTGAGGLGVPLPQHAIDDLLMLFEDYFYRKPYFTFVFSYWRNYYAY